jgi:hypothetical protein
MNLKPTLLTAALSLILRATTAQAADIQITSLPCFITVPGTYIFKSNLSVNGVFESGITVDSAVAGPIIIDLKGWTLSTAVDQGGAGIYIGNNSTASPITIRNGVIQGGAYGVDVNRNVSFEVATTNYILNVHIKEITFSNIPTAVLFNQTNLSSVTDCAFTAVPNSPMVGILDIASQGGNHYRNDHFDGNERQQLIVAGAYQFPFAAGPAVLKDCRFQAPAKQKSNLELESANE